MQGFVRGVVWVLAFAVVAPLSASTLDRDANCDMQKKDLAKLSQEDKQAVVDKCAAQLRAEDCGISGVDMSMMSAGDQQTMKESCVDKMKHLGCDLKGVDVSKISAVDAQKLMDQCHEKRAKPVSMSTGAAAAVPTPKPE